MPTGADGLVWLASVGFGGLAGVDLLEQRAEPLASSHNFFNMETFKDYSGRV